MYEMRAQTIELIVTVPPGAGPGTQLTVQTPAGMATVAVPPGLSPGQQFRIQVAAPQQQPVYQQQPVQQQPVYQQQPVQQQLVQRQPMQLSADYTPPPMPSSIQGGSEGYSSSVAPRSHLHVSPVNDYHIQNQCGDQECYKFICCPCYTPCCCCCLTRRVYCVRSGTVAMVEKFSKYVRTAEPGELLLDQPCGPCLPWEQVGKTMSLRVQQLAVSTNTKTKDNVFVTIGLTLMYQVASAQSAYDAAYKPSDFNQQIGDFVEQTIRSVVAKIKLDDIFTTSREISVAVFEDASPRMNDFGCEIVQTLVTSIEPERKVKTSMNEINMQKRLKEAQVFAAEASKAIEVKRAEADAEAKYLAGVGLARQRKAMINGFAENIASLDITADGDSSDDATTLLLTNQYLDVMEQLAKDARAGQNGQNGTVKLIFPSGVNGLVDIYNRLDFFKQAYKA